MIWGLMVPSLSQRWLIFTNLRSRFISKLFLNFLANFMNWLFDKMYVGSFKQEIHSCPCFWLFWLYIFTVLFKYYLKSRFFAKNTPRNTIINIFNAELC